MHDIGDNDGILFFPGSNAKADPAVSAEQPVIPDEVVPHGSEDIESSGVPQHSREASDPNSPTEAQGNSIDPEQEQLLLAMIKSASGNPNMSIECQSQLVMLTPDGHKDKPSRLNELGLLHHQRFELLGRPEDIELAVESLSRAASAVPYHSLEKSICLVNLGSCYRSRFERHGDIADVMKAIEFQSQAIALGPEEHPDKPMWLNNIGNSYQRLFECQGDPVNLQTAIDFKSQAISLVPDDHKDKPILLCNVGSSFGVRFDYLGELADIDDSITYHRLAVSLTPDRHEDKPRFLTSLGISYQRRFLRLGEFTDIAEAIRNQHLVVVLTPDDYADKPLWLNNLGISYQERFQARANKDDCDKSIQHLKEAVSLIPEDHARLPNILNNLGNSHHHRFRYLQDIADLEQSIAYNTRAVSLSRAHGERLQLANFLTNLAVLHRTRFGFRYTREDVNLAINYLEEADSLTPNESSSKMRIAYQLGCAYHERMIVNIEGSQLPAVVSCFERAALSSAGLPQLRFLATRRWAILSFVRDPPSARLAFQKAMDLASQIVWIGSTIDHRYKLVRNLENIAVEAASYAIVTQDYGNALEWLEVGRSIVWNQIHQLRTPLDDLAAVDPTLAKKIQQVARGLELASTRSPGILGDQDILVSEQEAQRHHRLVSEWDQLIDQVRQISQFQNFMRPRRVQELQRAARDGPVVVINVHDHVDALILEPNKSEIGHVSVGGFSREKAALLRTQLESLISSGGVRARGFRRQQRQSKVSFRDVLGALWSDVVEPILDYLGYVHQASPDVLPHITWCTTGPLSFLPLHAAGRYVQGELNTPDLVISSYTPTLGALITSALPRPTNDTAILVVGQEHTIGLPPLPCTVAELASIKGHIGATKCLQLSGQAATVDAVLTAMGNYNWVHFACHASQNVQEPILSAIHLHDGDLNLKTIIRQTFRNKGLAFLSACQTSTGDETIPDEAVHLAAGILAAGYPSVISTMWEISDEDGPTIAGQVYARVVGDQGMDQREVARALHLATKHLRETIGTESFIRWVPFVHFGV